MPLKHLLRLLTLLALLLAPAGMLGSHRAMAAPQASGAAAGGHCVEAKSMSHEAPGGEETKPSIDCFIACSCVPAPGAQLAERTLFAELPASGAPSAMGSGLNPQADPPPPRLS